MEKISYLKRIVYTLVCVIGLGVAGGGSYGFYRLHEVEQYYVPVTGRIKSIVEHKEYRRGKRRVYYDVTVSYPVGNVSYEAPLNIQSSFMEVGDPVAILYNPENPDEIREAESEKVVYGTMMGCGLILLLSDWLLLPLMFRHIERRRREEE
ncbi:MAG: DUF3592 domain-containing protein [Parabacteroides sp.]|nr:DUF3592 domain-containing protein [Parabacteroides sp.]